MIETEEWVAKTSGESVDAIPSMGERRAGGEGEKGERNSERSKERMARNDRRHSPP
ncbi:MAG: hypothetical protein NW203_12185 [Hyphomonadaceae bacterium]|nr:hypothetical protein [Hyphomonadaceae bacterium]